MHLHPVDGKSSISANFKEERLQYNTIYLDKMETGKHVYEAIVKGTVIEEALPKKFKEALKIYRKSSRTIDLIQKDFKKALDKTIQKRKYLILREIARNKSDDEEEEVRQ